MLLSEPTKSVRIEYSAVFTHTHTSRAIYLYASLDLTGAHESHCFNNQSTHSYLFKIVNKTTIPVVIDDISAKAADTWEELFIDAYNGTSRGTRFWSQSETINVLY